MHPVYPMFLLQPGTRPVPDQRRARDLPDRRLPVRGADRRRRRPLRAQDLVPALLPDPHGCVPALLGRRRLRGLHRRRDGRRPRRDPRERRDRRVGRRRGARRGRRAPVDRMFARSQAIVRAVMVVWRGRVRLPGGSLRPHRAVAGRRFVLRRRIRDRPASRWTTTARRGAIEPRMRRAHRSPRRSPAGWSAVRDQRCCACCACSPWSARRR